MNHLRRVLLKWFVTGVGLSAVQALASTVGKPAPVAFKVVVIGGGFAGATFARALRQLAPNIAITLIEPNRLYHCCPLSVEFLVGKCSEERLLYGYEKLVESGIEVLYDRAGSIDAVAKRVCTESGVWHEYDRCVVATGIGYRYDTLAGYDEAAIQQFPHAWGGADQLRLLKAQLFAMHDGGTVLISAPPDDYRCPPGPYERASLIAQYLKKYKPRSRVIILDAKTGFAKQAQFEQVWTRLYNYGTADSIIRWVGAQDGGTVVGLDADRRQLLTVAGPVYGDVINLIPAQQADKFAHRNGLASAHGWCPVNTQTFESLHLPSVHVIGDSAYAEMLPKSAFAASCQARVCAMAIYSQLHGLPLMTPYFMNVCYSLCAEDYAISVYLHYQHDPTTNILDVQTLRVTPLNAEREDYRREAQSAYSMFSCMVKEAFG